MSPKTPYKGLLVYHKIGGGKTCVAISISEKFKHQKKIIVVLPASLRNNFRNELRSQCAGNQYLTAEERQQLQNLDPTEDAYQEIIERSNERIDKYYEIYSYIGFVRLVQTGLDLRNKLMIIDEIQNMVSEVGIYYEYAYTAILNAPNDFRIVVMTATPIFDKPFEIARIMNLLINNDVHCEDRDDLKKNCSKLLPTGRSFNKHFLVINKSPTGITYDVQNMDKFKNFVRGYVSYYRGAPSYVFPKTTINIVRCRMSDDQLELYQIIAKNEYQKEDFDFISEKISNEFYVGTRMTSNFMYPYEENYLQLTNNDFKLSNLAKYSDKFYHIIKQIQKSIGPIFIYSSFKRLGGIYSLVRALEVNGWLDYDKNGTGHNRFAVWSGDETMNYKEKIRNIFNQKNNEDGSKLKIIIGSSAIKEGVSFLRVSEVHIVEPYWNLSRLDQVMGRAIRFCSHKDVPKNKQKVMVYIYISYHPKLKKSVDERIMEMAITKRQISSYFEKALKEVAIDCDLFHNANDEMNDPIVCEN